MSLLGLDISHWQDPTPSLTGIGFVFVKATQGDSFVDPAYTTHAGHILSRGVELASYHWAIFDDPFDAQARFYVAHSAQAKALAIDNEVLRDSLGRAIKRKMTVSETTALIAATKRADSLHRLVGLYMNEWDYIQGGYRVCGQDFVWLAKWSVSPPAAAWDIWQYSNGGGKLDRDRAKDQATFDRIFRVPPESDTGHTLHIAHNALVRAYAISSRGCILKVNGKYGVDRVWTGGPSKAPCSAPVYRKTCDGISHSTTVKVLAGVFAGKHIGLNAGVTVS